MWTRFMDMHSGGGQKLKHAYIYIEAPQAEAEIIFYNMFDRNPNRVTCTCCGSDYSITETDKGQTLKDMTAYERGCDTVYIDRQGKEHKEDEWYKKSFEDRVKCTWKYKTKERQKPNGGIKYRTLAQYKKRKNVKIICKKDIKTEHRKGTLPEEGYIWR